jgi:hypothetical protein
MVSDKVSYKGFMNNIDVNKLEIFMDMFYFNYTLQGYGEPGIWDTEVYVAMKYTDYLRDLKVTACNTYGDKLSLRVYPKTIEW